MLNSHLTIYLLCKSCTTAQYRTPKSLLLPFAKPSEPQTSSSCLHPRVVINQFRYAFVHGNRSSCCKSRHLCVWERRAAHDSRQQRWMHGDRTALNALLIGCPLARGSTRIHSVVVVAYPHGRSPTLLDRLIKLYLLGKFVADGGLLMPSVKSRSNMHRMVETSTGETVGLCILF